MRTPRGMFSYILYTTHSTSSIHAIHFTWLRSKMWYIIKLGTFIGQINIP